MRRHRLWAGSILWLKPTFRPRVTVDCATEGEYCHVPNDIIGMATPLFNVTVGTAERESKGATSEKAMALVGQSGCFVGSFRDRLDCWKTHACVSNE